MSKIVSTIRAGADAILAVDQFARRPTMISQLRTSKSSRFSVVLAAALTIGIAASAQAACYSPQVAGSHSNGTPCVQHAGGGGTLPPPAINPRGSYNGGLGSNGPFGNGGGTITLPGGGSTCVGAEFRCYSPQ